MFALEATDEAERGDVDEVGEGRPSRREAALAATTACQEDVEDTDAADEGSRSSVVALVLERPLTLGRRWSPASSWPPAFRLRSECWPRKAHTGGVELGGGGSGPSGPGAALIAVGLHGNCAAGGSREVRAPFLICSVF